MTNTLHRFGTMLDSFCDDYVVFAMASKGRNDEGRSGSCAGFLEIAVKFKPVNLGDAIHGGALRPRQEDESGGALEARCYAGFRGL